MKFCTRVCLKSWNDQGEFELDGAKSKNYIAENPVALGYDTHNIILLMTKSWQSSRIMANVSKWKYYKQQNPITGCTDNISKHQQMQ